ncbi:transporter substrate-binding domain-containing protein [Lactococcus fujiensis]|uniref:Amino acid ABC transporter substrate-binding protein n=1 Tax=Lactococcus fujiensis JCM 16395 TaxID=1291764 RepID=A0A2A5RIN7_9LACT|nr:transporter substrate-binding domain-containing protein [Lactococcus fujiensis]PCR98949.1 amino acid ABC transporter substrate-binding protein [Lactococcus fujiensis JCM 16395]
MKMKKILLGAILISATATLAACGKSSDSAKNQVDTIKKNGTLTVALSADYPPFEFQTIQNGKNTVVGSDVDLANAIGKKLGVKVKISNMDFSNVLSSVSSGKADLAISGITYTKERAKTYNFSKIYYHSPNSIIIKKSDLNKYTNLDSFANKQVAAQKGSMQEQIVLKDMKKSNDISLATIGDEVNEVKTGKVEGAVVETLIAQSYVDANPDLALAKVEMPELASDYGMSVAMPKDSSELTKAVNEVITEMLQDGTMDKNIQKNYELAKTVK